MRREQNSRSPLQFTWLQFTSKRKIPVPATKKGRRSWKKVSKAVRLRTAGSASTCPKSGFTVASSVRLDVSPYFRSAPPVSLWDRSKPLPAGTDTFFVTAYGATSSRVYSELVPGAPVVVGVNHDLELIGRRAHVATRQDSQDAVGMGIEGADEGVEVAIVVGDLGFRGEAWVAVLPRRELAERRDGGSLAPHLIVVLAIHEHEVARLAPGATQRSGQQLADVVDEVHLERGPDL